MEQKIKIFENEEFGRVRTIVRDGEPWLVGKDVAEILSTEIRKRHYLITLMRKISIKAMGNNS